MFHLVILSTLWIKIMALNSITKNLAHVQGLVYIDTLSDETQIVTLFVILR